MKLAFSQADIITTAKSLGLPTDGFIQRRVARAYDLLESNKVSQIDDGIFRVRSQYEPDKSYIVNLNHGDPSCDCPDGKRTINCKHRIASLLYARKQEQATQMIIRKRDDGVYCIIDGNRLIQIDNVSSKLFCNCKECRYSKQQADCKYKKAIRNSNGTKRIVNECGSNSAKALQDKLNSQLDSRNGNGNGAENVPSQQLDQNDPFQLSELLDIGQIEGRGNGDLVHRLHNGEYVISYRGIMRLSEKHHITFDEAIHSDTYTVIAKGRCRTSERVSGKPINGNVETALELAKRNAARQLLPLVEIKAMERKAKLNAEFDWQKAQAKCVELVGTKANVDIIIHDLTQAGKLRQDNPSHYDRTEWLMIYNACEKEASVERSPKSLNNWSYNSAMFIDKCKEAIDKVRAEKKVEANDQPMEGSNGKRKLQMDKKLNTWLIEADGTKKAISCREICEQFQDGSIVTRLREGIDSGADISTVELDD